MGMESTTTENTTIITSDRDTLRSDVLETKIIDPLILNKHP